MNSPRVSVIIPTYNRASLLPRAVNSVLAQTFTDFELIIVDDASPDDTPAVIAAMTDPRIRAFRHESNRMLSAARNTGIANARGEYIAFLDDDDEFLPTKLEKQVAALDAADPDVGMVYGWYDDVGPTGEIVGRVRDEHEGDIFEQVLGIAIRTHISCAAMIRASVIDMVGQCDEDIGLGEDVDFESRITKVCKTVLIRQKLTNRYVGHGQMTTYSRCYSRRLRDFAFKHMEKFRGDFDESRVARAAIWLKIALCESHLRNYRGVIRAGVIASRNDPKTAWLLAEFVGRRALRTAWAAAKRVGRRVIGARKRYV